LLTYDLDLVAMAAEFTQKDPKEYVPYLEELRAITDELDRRTRICLDLKKYDQAI
jgi:elongator complex protein 1